jgi:lipopolysaccharide export system ATP-binding protein
MVAAMADETGDGSGLRVDRVSKTFGARAVVKNISLHLARREVAALLGPNGAGKTTCFYMITGLISVDSGTISLDGRDITDMPMYLRARQGLGYLPQEISVFRGLTVEQNIMAIVEARVADSHRIREVTEELLSELGLGALRKVEGGALSGGELRRVEIARALASDPTFMLLDEPFAGVDPLGVDGMREAIMYLKRRGLGVLITDHDVHATLEIVDRVSVIRAGEMLFEGSPEAVIHDPEVRRLYLGEGFV